MRAREFITEADMPADLKRLGKDGDNLIAALKGGLSIPGISINKSNGNPYAGYRFGLSMAGANGKNHGATPKTGALSGDPLLTVYTQEEYEIIQQAAKEVMAGPIKKLSDMASREPGDTYKQSPVAKPKRNKYGV
jgi:hypothetical protein